MEPPPTSDFARKAKFGNGEIPREKGHRRHGAAERDRMMATYNLEDIVAYDLGNQLVEGGADLGDISAF